VQNGLQSLVPMSWKRNLGAAWHILLDQFTNIMLLMLIAVAVVSALLGEARTRSPFW